MTKEALNEIDTLLMDKHKAKIAFASFFESTKIGGSRLLAISVFLISITMSPPQVRARSSDSIVRDMPTDSVKISHKKDSLANVKTELEIIELRENLGGPGNLFTILFSLIGGLLTIVAGIVSGVLAARWQSKIEAAKWKRQKRDTFESELLNNVKEFTISIASALHSMCWLCWLAEYGPERLSGRNIKLYDKEMHVMLPKIAGISAVIAGMDYQVYEKIMPVVTDIYRLDSAIGRAGLEYQECQPSTGKALAILLEKSIRLEQTFSHRIAQAIKHYSTTMPS
jgi:hypothetical protein